MHAGTAGLPSRVMNSWNSCLKLIFLGLSILQLWSAFSPTTYEFVDFQVEEMERWKDNSPKEETIKGPKEPRKGDKKKKNAGNPTLSDNS